MAGLLSGLEAFGLKGLDKVDDIYDKAKKEEEAKRAEEIKKDPVLAEQELLFEKSYTCPICDTEFKSRTVKIGKAKLLGTDLDLRPKYESVDMLKYDIILCPHCGYAALSRYFKFLTAPQAKLIKENISASFKPMKEQGIIYSYEEALARYKLTLANAIVKRAKASEKAYICLKTAWLLRGQGEHLKEEDADYSKKKAEIDKEEDEFLRNALEGFLSARQAESFPMCGMDEVTVDYLIAVIAMRFEQFDISSRLISSILVSHTASPRMKDKARDIKEMLVKQIKENQAKKGKA
ncbi:MAG: DUF2225 domain-containing protein [Lachnospiraceae bacterium]|nr:DUF2225 domain-containing protein [Lachnospiraceae bacterium]